MVEDDMRKLGYDREEEYFYKLNKELLEKRRKALDEQRAGRESQAESNPHWMRCPKCGGGMEERDLQGIKVDQCAQCQGIYFDRGELELLMESREAKGFLGGLKRLFG